MPRWDPEQYERFADLRDRPFHDLVARVGAEAPRRVVDLGCGNGPLTLSLARRWERASVTGIDSSEQMIARAREVDHEHRVTWELADVAQWQPDPAQPPDVVVTNATLQWVPDHVRLVAQWLRQLPEGGWFAMQVPGNFEAASHRIIREVALAGDRRELLTGVLRDSPVEDPATYAEVLSGSCGHVDVWEATYLQILDPAGTQRSPVLEWVKGTALRPVLEALDAQEREVFLAELAARFEVAYPRRDYGTPMPFRRIFAVGRVGA